VSLQVLQKRVSLMIVLRILELVQKPFFFIGLVLNMKNSIRGVLIYCQKDMLRKLNQEVLGVLG